MNQFFNLAYTTPDVLEKINAAEAKGEYSSHLDPIDYSDCLPVDENFPYIPGFGLRFIYWIRHVLFLYKFTRDLNKKIFHTKVIGREYLNGLPGAVVVCNHINKYDGLVMRWALKGHGLKYMVADFNNHKGALGRYMRADGILPFKNSLAVIRKFNAAIKYYLARGTNVLFFPEGSEWWCYEKPRPFMDGAFHYAAENNAPVLPVFITFTPTDNYTPTGIKMPDFTVNIMQPVYPEEDKTRSENTKMLKNAAYKAWCEKYTEFYHKDLNF